MNYQTPDDQQQILHLNDERAIVDAEIKALQRYRAGIDCKIAQLEAKPKAPIFIGTVRETIAQMDAEISGAPTIG